MKKYYLITISVLAIAFAFGNLNAQTPPANGETIYKRKCARCHGDNGTPKKKGVSPLKESDMTDAETLEIITNGEDKMPAFKKKLSSEEIKAVAVYIKVFKKK